MNYQKIQIDFCFYLGKVQGVGNFMLQIAIPPKLMMRLSIIFSQATNVKTPQIDSSKHVFQFTF